MGCDIHFTLEMQDENKRWVGVYSTDLTPNMIRADEKVPDTPDCMQTFYRRPAFKERNYGFFGQLAGVRSATGPDPLGLPQDLSALSQRALNRWEGDGHSHSWLPYLEFCKRYALVEGHIFTTKGAMEVISGIGDYDTNADEYDLYRVVFWFDN